MFGLLAASVLQKPVVLPDRAMRLDALLKTLSAQGGETCRASGEMASRIVIVAGPSRPATAVRADLATATFGKWRQSGGEWLLEEDREAMRAREAKRLAARVAEVRAQQAKLRAEADKPFDATAAKALLAAFEAYDRAEKADPGKSYPYMEKANALSFSDAAVKRVVASLDPVEIASLERGSAAYSDRPTRLQRPLQPELVSEVVGRMARDQGVWTGVFIDGAGWREGRNGYLSADPRAYPDPIDPANLRTFVKAEAFEHGQTMFTIQFIDAKGVSRQFGEFSINFSDRAERPDPSPTVDPKEPPIPLSPEATAYSDAQMGRGRSPLLRPILLRPERREPLDLLCGEGLRDVAKARNASVVAWLDDSLARQGLGSWKGKPQEPSASGWLRAMWLFGEEVRTGTDGFVLRPRAGGRNVDRNLVGELTRTVDRVGYLPLDDAATYAAAIGATSQSIDTLAGVLLESAVPGVETLFIRADWRALALWGGFTPVQRGVLLTRGTVPWNSIDKAQQDRIVAAVLHAENNEIQRRGPAAVYTALSNEPTEVLAGNAAMGDGLTGTGQAEEGVFAPSTDDNPYNGGFASPFTLASAVVSRERKPGDEHYDGLPKTLPTGFVPGRSVEFGFTATLAPGLIYQKYGQIAEVDLRQRPQPLDSLSPEFRKRYAQALEEQRKTNDRSPR